MGREEAGEALLGLGEFVRSWDDLGYIHCCLFCLEKGSNILKAKKNVQTSRICHSHCPICIIQCYYMSLQVNKKFPEF